MHHAFQAKIKTSRFVVFALAMFATSLALADQTESARAAKAKRDAYIRAHGDQVVPNRATQLMLNAMQDAGIKVSKPVLRQDNEGNPIDSESQTQGQGLCSNCELDVMGRPGKFKKQDIAIFGRDERNDKGTRYEEQSAVVKRLAESIGFVECPTKSNREISNNGTATLVTNQRTLLTAKHTFFEEINGKSVRLTNCLFYRTDYENNEFVTYKIDPASIPLHPPTSYEDEVVEIRTVNPVAQMIPLIKKAVDPTATHRFLLFAYSHDIADGDDIRIQTGITQSLPQHSNLNRNLVGGHTLDTNGMASGAPLIDPLDGRVFGIHVGVESNKPVGTKQFKSGDPGAVNAFTFLN